MAKSYHNEILKTSNKFNRVIRNPRTPSPDSLRIHISSPSLTPIHEVPSTSHIPSSDITIDPYDNSTLNNSDYSEKSPLLINKSKSSKSATKLGFRRRPPKSCCTEYVTQGIVILEIVSLIFYASVLIYTHDNNFTAADSHVDHDNSSHDHKSDLNMSYSFNQSKGDNISRSAIIMPLNVSDASDEDFTNSGIPSPDDFNVSQEAVGLFIYIVVVMVYSLLSLQLAFNMVIVVLAAGVKTLVTSYFFAFSLSHLKLLPIFFFYFFCTVLSLCTSFLYPSNCCN